jgi:peroxiredoxin
MFQGVDNILIRSTLLGTVLLAASAHLALAAPPAVGDKARDFSLSDVSGKPVRLSETVPAAPVVLVVLRGFPGYQCPFCNRQVQDFLEHQQQFKDAGVKVLLVYPGPPADLGSHAAEFLTGKQLPAHFQMLLDPGYEFTNKYDLRWDAPRETAYPSTFLIDRRGVIFFSKVAKEHGGRATASEILAALAKHRAEQ